MACGFMTADFDSDEEDYMDDDETATQTDYTQDDGAMTARTSVVDPVILPVSKNSKNSNNSSINNNNGSSSNRATNNNRFASMILGNTNNNTNNNTNSKKKRSSTTKGNTNVGGVLWGSGGGGSTSLLPTCGAGDVTTNGSVGGGNGDRSSIGGDTKYFDATTVGTTTIGHDSVGLANNKGKYSNHHGNSTMRGGGGGGSSLTGDILNTPYENATPLFKNIEKENWNGVLQFLNTGKWSTSFFGDVVSSGYEHLKNPTAPIQARTWVTYYDKKTGEPEWSQLPLHTALSYKAPFVVIQKLVEVFPKAVQCTDREGMLPIHLAFGFDCPDTILALLLEAFPASLDEKCGVGGRLPYECCDLGPNKIRGKVFSIIADQTYMKTKEEFETRWKQFAKAAMKKLNLTTSPVTGICRIKNSGGSVIGGENEKFDDDDDTVTKDLDQYFKDKPLTEFVLELLEDRKELLELKQKLTERLSKAKNSNNSHSNSTTQSHTAGGNALANAGKLLPRRDVLFVGSPLQSTVVAPLTSTASPQQVNRNYYIANSTNTPASIQSSSIAAVTGEMNSIPSSTKKKKTFTNVSTNIINMTGQGHNGGKEVYGTPKTPKQQQQMPSMTSKASEGTQQQEQQRRSNTNNTGGRRRGAVGSKQPQQHSRMAGMNFGGRK